MTKTNKQNHTKHIFKSDVIGNFSFGWMNTYDKDNWIYGRFEEPDKAIKYFDCNKFSGKMNFFTNNDALAWLMDTLVNIKFLTNKHK